MNAVVSALINGEPGDRVSIQDRGFQYGDGLFETLAVSQGRPLWWERHMRRLFAGAARLGITPPGEAVLREEAWRLCKDVERAVMKIVLTRGVSGRGYAVHQAMPPTRVISLLPWPDYPESHAMNGVDVRVCRATLSRNSRLAGIKHLNRLEQVLARAEWRDEYAEGLMLDEGGLVIEATMSNLFLVHNGVLLTPDLSACGVEGIMRGLVLEKAELLSLPSRVATMTQDDVFRAEELFLTNSLFGLWPVKKLDWSIPERGSKEYPVGKITQAIQEAVAK
ncbi:MAG: aminodeoxychorismate lyase [Gammaproteobacteria bacterium]|nr:MAG: aminodeoxychorismate lyase [Gammaproteobacteria bacterium]